MARLIGTSTKTAAASTTTENLSWLRVTIDGNDASNGGGIFSTGELLLSDSQVANNTAAGSGGGIAVQSGQVIIERSEVDNNQARIGGAVTVLAGQASFNHARMAANQSDLEPAGLFVAGGDVTLDQTVIGANFADDLESNLHGTLNTASRALIGRTPYGGLEVITVTQMANDNHDSGGITLQEAVTAANQDDDIDVIRFRP